MSELNEYNSYLQRLAEKNAVQGVMYEPRIFYDAIDLDGALPTRSQDGVFRNGGRFPIRITHMTAAMASVDALGAAQDPRLLQRVGGYFMFHGQYYMNPPQQLTAATPQQPTSLAAWANVLSAGPDVISRGTSAQKFIHPFILSVRDTLKVTVQLVDSPAYPIRVTVSFTGVGIISRQPYFLSGFTDIPVGTAQVDIDTTRFLNDGAEPILVTDMTINSHSPENLNDPTGDAAFTLVQVKQIGNGTNEDWAAGPVGTNQEWSPGVGITNLCPSILWGSYSGRALVHRFPGDGLVWEPGEGIDLYLQALADDTEDTKVMVGLVGYVAVQ